MSRTFDSFSASLSFHLTWQPRGWTRDDLYSATKGGEKRDESGRGADRAIGHEKTSKTYGISDWTGPAL